LAQRLCGISAGFLLGLVLALNPLFIAHSRVLAMDALLVLFLLISVLSFLVWIEEKKRWYLIFSGAAGALAVLSKMAGVVLLPCVGLVFFILLVSKRLTLRETVLAAATWGMSFVLVICIAFPTIVTDFSYVWAGTQEFFATEHFQQAVHALGPFWYPQALLIWSTPLQLTGLAGAVILLFRSEQKMRYQILVLLGFAVLFFLAMQYSIKKGDRYILPVFLMIDVVTAIFCAWLLRNFTKSLWVRGLVMVIAVTFFWQAVEVLRLHPYALAYRNPFFRDVAVGRTMGWGEGLDLAAAYLNDKPNAEHLIVASYYESSFAHQFKGKFTSAERLFQETAQEIGADYVVLYRTMEGRSADRWETQVLQEYRRYTPEHIISLNGEEYVWIYRVDS
jgi:4-amino-4-deoxy-L-arabinose transferase-like glycosyltransferase